jgi:uncharacterized protein (DUF2062 family)
MKRRAASRPKPERPWWRTPFQFLLRARLRRRHVHGTLLHRLLGERLFAPRLWIPNAESAALGMALGTFVGFLPLPGLQTFFAVIFCYIFRANIAAAVLATFITNPFTTLAIVALQYKLGVWLLPALKLVETDEYRTVGRSFAAYGKPFLMGSLVSSVALGLLAYPVTLGAWKLAAAGMARRKVRLAAERAARRGSPHETKS